MQEKYHILISIVIASAFIFLFAFATLLFYFQFTRKKQRLQLNQQLLEKRYQQELLEVGMEVQEHTFQHISQDIHDSVGQMLSLAKLNLSILAIEHQHLGSIKEIRDQISEAIHQLRQISMGFQGDGLLEKGLLNGIEFLVLQMRKTGLFNMQLDAEMDWIAINKNDSVFIYRIFQELMQNIIRHSGATDISITIQQTPEQYLFLVRDNGHGFSINNLNPGNGIGLRSIQQRAALIGAQLAIESKPEKGTLVSITYKKKSDDNPGIG